MRTPHYPAILLVLLVVSTLLAAPGCRRASGHAAADTMSSEGVAAMTDGVTDREEISTTPTTPAAPATPAAPSTTADETPTLDGATDSLRPFLPPSLEVLGDSALTPYHHNPVTWQFLNLRSLPEGLTETRVAMTTTAERVLLRDLGLLFKLVVEVRLPGVDLGAGSTATTEFRSHVALLTPEGLYVSEPNVFSGNLSVHADELAADLMREPPSWPLPGSFRCEYSVRDVTLPIGNIRGVWTSCPDTISPYGPASVSTLWVDQVGFVYREIIVAGPDEPVRMRDVLIGSDVAELAPPAVDEPLNLLPELDNAED